MKLEGSQAVGAVVIVTILGLLQCLAFYLVNPSTYGISLGWRFDIPGRGWMVREAFSPKTKDFESFVFYLREGQELNLDLDIEIESGWVYTAVVRRRGLTGLDFISTKVYQASTQESRTITAPRSGFYRIHIDIMKFKGVVRAKWGS